MRYALASAFNSLLRAFGFKSLNAQFSFAFGIIMALSIAISAALWMSLEDSEETINIAGKQRMLSQKIAKEALMVSYGVVEKNSVQTLMTRFEQTQDQLLKGDANNRINAPTNAALKNELESANQKWHEYAKTVNAYLDKPSKELASQINQESNQLVDLMNTAVTTMAADAHAKKVRLSDAAIVSSVLILLVCFISQFVGFKWLIDQVRCLQKHLNYVGSGDFTHTITAESSDNEIGDAFNAYNAMLEQTRTIIKTSQQLVTQLAAQASQLDQAVVASDNNLDRQNQQLSAVSAASTEMTGTIREVANNAQEATNAAKSAHQAAERSKTTIEQSAQYTTDLSREMAKAMSVLQELDGNSQQIGTVLTVITGIAEQTNLLALNAAIEAARAGEQGRGFAVVADEVRTLASKTQESTEEIRKIIERLQQQSSNAVEAMSRSNDQAMQSARQTTEAKNTLEQLFASAESILTMSSHIACAAEQQSVAANEIDRSVANIAANGDHTANLTQNLRAMSQQLNGSVDSLNQLTSRLAC